MSESIIKWITNMLDKEDINDSTSIELSNLAGNDLVSTNCSLYVNQVACISSILTGTHGYFFIGDFVYKGSLIPLFINNRKESYISIINSQQALQKCSINSKSDALVNRTPGNIIKGIFDSLRRLDVGAFTHIELSPQAWTDLVLTEYATPQFNPVIKLDIMKTDIDNYYHIGDITYQDLDIPVYLNNNLEYYACISNDNTRHLPLKAGIDNVEVPEEDHTGMIYNPYKDSWSFL